MKEANDDDLSSLLGINNSRSIVKKKGFKSNRSLRSNKIHDTKSQKICSKLSVGFQF